MAWTDAWWPVSSATSNLLSCANELRTELNARAGTAVAAFSAGDSTWNVIKALRDAVDGAVTDFYKGDDWRQYVGCGVAGSGSGVGGTINIFLDVLGAGRGAWRNTAAGVEASGPAYDPPGGGDPYAFHFNELHDIIDAMKWKRVVCSAYSDGSHSALERIGGMWWYGGYPPSEGWASASDALDAAWTEATGATASGSPVAVTMAADYVYSSYSYPEDYFCHLELRRNFFQASIPSGVTAAKLYAPGHAANYYDAADSPYDRTTNPSWNTTFYISSTSPGTLTDADWSFGSLGATVPCPDAVGPGATPTSVVDLSNYTAGSTNYLQERSDEAKPTHIAASDYWGSFSIGELRKGVATAPCIFYKLT